MTLNELLQIDGGRGYIENIYPDSLNCFDDRRKKFKTRNEKTPSASVYQKDGVWYVTDFGNDQRRRHAVDVCMIENGIDFGEAMRQVSAFYKVENKGSGSLAKAEFDKWTAKPDEAEGAVNIEYKEFDMFELKTLFAEYSWRAMGKTDEERKAVAIQKCVYYHYKAVKSYTYTKGGITMKYSSTNEFPIFSIEEGTWKKIYKPKDQKQYRFFSTGEKPVDFMHGLEQLINFVAEKRKNDDADENKRNYQEFKLEEVIICTGGSDALNVAALGYHVVWLNSETAKLTSKHYKSLNDKAKYIYNLPDIDETGKREAHELGLQYLDIRTIRLPETLKERKDLRGNPCKDVRDYFKCHTKYEFDQLVKVSLPYQFWEQEQKLNKDDEPVFKFGKPVYSYNFNNVRAYNFLYYSGFARYKSEKEKEGFFFIKIDSHVVRVVEVGEIRDFINNFLENRFFGEDLRNVVYRSPQLSEQSLANLPLIELDFCPYDFESQYLFFQKYNPIKKDYDGSVWRVMASGIEEVKGAAGKYVWQDKVISRKIKVLPNFFSTAKTENDWNIEITEDSPMVLRFLIQTCRVHWRKELEDRLGICSRLRTLQERKEYAEKHGLSDDEFKIIFDSRNTEDSEFVKAYQQKFKYSITGALLTAAEQAEQKQHLLNRIYCIGYLLHRYKNPSKPWGVWVMDNKLADEGESHGGSGKSLLVKLLLYMNLSTVSLDGRNPRLTDNPHVFENVDQSTDLLNIDDCYDYFNFGYFFSALTSDINVNPKNKKGFQIPFNLSPKFIFSSNYGDRATDPSSLRRKLYTVYSDYYHENNGDYNETRSPADEFGRNLFIDWDDNDWEQYYNFMAQCLSFYLKSDKKIIPPMGNVSKRNLLAEMTEGFKVWADTYFSPNSGRVNVWYQKLLAFEDFKREAGLKNTSTTSWKKRLVAYCKYMKYELNPEDEGSNIKKIKITDADGNHQETSREFIYIKVDSKLVANTENMPF